MIKAIINIIIIVLFSFNIYAQYQTQWAANPGGTDSENGRSVCVDKNGDVYVAAITISDDFDTLDMGGGAYFEGVKTSSSAIVIQKYNKAGTLLWSTFYNGDATSFVPLDTYIKITTDNTGNVFVTGSTTSANFPTYSPGGSAFVQDNNAGYNDIFILKFNNNGVRQWATYYGGSSYDVAYDITADNAGNVYITGLTYSSDFPVYIEDSNMYFQNAKAGGYDIFILKFNNNGIRQWATYYGGAHIDAGYGITADNTGNIFIAGQTGSVDFPVYDAGAGTYYQDTLSGIYQNVDAFILKFNSSGVRQWATYYGGSAADLAEAISVDDMDNVFIGGRTFSSDFPIYNPDSIGYLQDTEAGDWDIFVMEFDNNGIRKWSTYYGGSAFDKCYSIATDKSGNVFLTGETSSADFPTHDAGGGADFQGTKGTGKDAFVSKFDSAGIMQWATFYGGNDNDAGMSIAAADTGYIYVAGFFNSDSITFGAHTLYNTGSQDMFVAKIGYCFTDIDFVADLTTIPLDGQVKFTDLSASATSWLWDFGDGDTSTEQDPVHIYSETGTFTVQLLINGDCGDDSITKVYYITVVDDSILYSLSGSVYAGSDLLPSGTVKIFNADKDSIHPAVYETDIQNGTFNFDDILPVLYTVYAIPDYPESVTYAPAYYVNKPYWEDAYRINVYGDVFGIDIHLGLNTGINNIDKKNNFISAYPNPVADNLNIGFEFDAKADLQLSVLNTMGQVVYTEELSKPAGNYSASINMKNFKYGIYIVNIRSDKLNYKFKVLKID